MGESYIAIVLIALCDSSNYICITVVLLVST